MVIRYKFKPHNTNVQNISTVEKDMCFEQDDIERRCHYQENIVEINVRDYECPSTC